uniref:Uncharacterized protein n=1 Tax=Cacopsylla melanoneura TaxID=428564 RepID=A0A8D8QX39_9HEMI
MDGKKCGVHCHLLFDIVLPQGKISRRPSGLRRLSNIRSMIKASVASRRSDPHGQHMSWIHKTPGCVDKNFMQNLADLTHPISPVLVGRFPRFSCWIIQFHTRAFPYYRIRIVKKYTKR